MPASPLAVSPDRQAGAAAAGGQCNLALPKDTRQKLPKSSKFWTQNLSDVNTEASLVAVSREMFGRAPIFWTLPHPFWIACSRSRQRVGAAAGQLVASAQLEGRLAQAVVAGTLQRAPHRTLQLTATHQPASGGNFFCPLFSPNCIHPTAVVYVVKLVRFWGKEVVGSGMARRSVSHVPGGALCIRQHPSHRCYRASPLPTFSIYLHRTSVLSLESQLDDFCGLRSVTDVSLQLHIGCFLTHQTRRNEDGQ